MIEKIPLFSMKPCTCLRMCHLNVFMFSGSAVEEQGQVLKLLFERPQFRINVVPDAPTVELCGALKVVLCVIAFLLWFIFVSSSTEHCSSGCWVCGWLEVSVVTNVWYSIPLLLFPSLLPLFLSPSPTFPSLLPLPFSVLLSLVPSLFPSLPPRLSLFPSVPFSSFPHPSSLSLLLPTPPSPSLSLSLLPPSLLPGMVLAQKVPSYASGYRRCGGLSATTMRYRYNRLTAP